MSYKETSEKWHYEEAFTAVRFVLKEFRLYTVAFSQQAEDAVLLDIITRYDEHPDVFTIDTGKLFPEAEEYNKAIEDRFKINIHRLSPDSSEVCSMIAEKGEDLYYASVDNRKLCCHVRKVDVLNRYLRNFAVWFTGLRRQQSPTRTALETLDYDQTTGIFKFSPLLGWTTEQIFEYLKSRDIPVNPLYERGYTSIGCAPCTRPTEPGEDIRQGRWWWESPEHKECGLHVKERGGK